MTLKKGKTYKRRGDSANLKIVDIKNGMVSYRISHGRYNPNKNVGLGLKTEKDFIQRIIWPKSNQ